MTPEERALLILVAKSAAETAAQEGRNYDAQDIFMGIEAIQTVEERLPHAAAIKNLDKK